MKWWFITGTAGGIATGLGALYYYLQLEKKKREEEERLKAPINPETLTESTDLTPREEEELLLLQMRRTQG